MDGRRHTRKTGEVIDCVRTRSPPLAKRANMGLYRTGFPQVKLYAAGRSR